MRDDHEFGSAKEAANDPRILVFGRLLGAANGLEYLLGKALENETGLTHSLFELLLVVGRAGEGGISTKGIAQAKVLTSGGATRLVHRGVELGLVSRRASTEDRRVQIVELTPEGERLAVEASTIHARNIEQLVLAILPANDLGAFEESVKVLSKHAASQLPVMP
ncbi:MarR family winged helix-turn-helix transcriptional regulator [Microbacterium sp. Leaf320]|uniref:MarR family winged helix-turn-helix transcriptional regulator n=1 Tax=Microbacterium sp. Leaf320 TaxID=1736334 RepID=UPI0006F31173|nr:MarR family transcriptional regulator [Microbacterium sp. Leaf320]KQQ67133.1 MarR family transcriptional regulator [Microbacterium sp. Leaf320]